MFRLFEITSKNLPEPFPSTNKLDLLAKIAHFMHERKVRSLSIDDVAVLVGNELSNPEDFLRHLQERSGLFVEYGPKLWGFSHLTFQEYLTALYLHEQQDGSAHLLDKPQRYNPWWREVILLYYGLGNSQSFLEALLAEDNLFQTNLLLAAYCLTDSTKRSQAPEVVQRLKEHVKNPKYEKLRGLGFEGLVAVAQGTATKTDGINALLELSSDSEWSVRDRAAQALGQLGQGNPQVVQRLLELFRDGDVDVRYRAAQALGQLGQGNPQVVRRLLELSRDSHSQGSVRYRAAQALGQLGQGNPQVVQGLLELFRDSEGIVRNRAAQALDTLSQNSAELSPQAVAQFKTWLVDDDLKDYAWQFLRGHAQATGNYDLEV